MNKIFVFLFFLFVKLSILNNNFAISDEAISNHTDTQDTKNCPHPLRNDVSSKPSINIDIFYVNLEHSFVRRELIQSHLHCLGYQISRIHRVAAVTPRHFIIPHELNFPQKCQQVANFSKAIIEDAELDETKHKYHRLNNHSELASILVTALCGRPKNSKKELAVTISHLKAIKEACHTNIEDDFALILEDDIIFAFQLDLHLLIDSAPPDFGILQLITTNGYDIQHMWKQFTFDASKLQSFSLKDMREKLWIRRSYHDLWCAGAYIIKKSILRPIIDELIKDYIDMTTGWKGQVVSVIAAYDKPCTPSYCCNGNILQVKSPCIRSARGYQSDAYIFSLVEGYSYMLKIPIFTGGRSGNISTLHQSHVSLHVESFAKINEITNEIRQRLISNNKDIPIPQFIK